jgi:hypothetical protein
VEARRYAALTTEEQDVIWNEEMESIEAAAEGDEVEVPLNKRLA